MTTLTSKLTTLPRAIARDVEPGMHVHFASTPSRSNAGIRELARTFRGRDPRFVLSTTGFHSTAHLLALLRLGRRYIACFFGDNYPVPRPNPLYDQLRREGAEVVSYSLLSYVGALRAGAMGLPFSVVASLRGTTLGEHLAVLGLYREVEIDAKTLSLVSSMRPDIAFVHTLVAAEDGFAVLPSPHSEGLWGALAASRGIIVTCERVVPAGMLAEHSDALQIPAHRVLAICHEPFGAHPQSVYSPARFDTRGYPDDFEHYQLWRSMSTQPDERFHGFVQTVLDADDGASGYRRFVGEQRLAALRETAAIPTSHRRPAMLPSTPPLSPVDPDRAGFHDGFARATEILITLAARTIAEHVRVGRFRTILVGIGHGFAAARLARDLLFDRDVDTQLMVETGMYGLEAHGSGDEFLLSQMHVAGAARLSNVEDVLGVLACGAGNRCLAVLGAAEVDARGRINSSRVGERWLVGSGGANDVASCAESVIVLTRINRLVPELEYVTSPGDQVRVVVTELCTFVRDDAHSSWRLRLVYPFLGGQPLDDAITVVRERCSWSFEVSDELEYAPVVSTQEMTWIHRHDPAGLAWTRE